MKISDCSRWYSFVNSESSSPLERADESVHPHTNFEIGLNLPGNNVDYV